MFNKRGVAQWFVITMIITVSGLVLVLYLLWSISIQSGGEEEICRLSVLTRATTPSALQGNIPLKCSTKKICLTGEYFGDCEQFAGEDNVMRIKLSRDESEAAREIERVSAEAMYSCWKAMGEGKLDLFSNENVANLLVPSWLTNLYKTDDGPTCVICSRVALDKDYVYKKDSEGKFTKEPTEKFKSVSSQVDMASYLKKTPAPSGSGLTYLQEFTDRQIISYPKKFDDELKKDVEDYKDGVVDETAIIFMQLISETDPTSNKELFDNEEATKAIVLTGAVAVGSFILTPVGGILIMKLGLGAMAVAGGTAGVLSAGYDNQERAISSLYCGEVTTGKKLDDGKLYGCSMVKTIDYDNINQINRDCSSIEGSL